MQKSVFKIGLIFGIIILFHGFSVPFSIHAYQGQVLSMTDLTNDVLDVTGKKVSRPNIDIYIISCFQEGKEVELIQTRRIWYWEGAASLSQLAMEGTSKPKDCKFPCAVNSIKLMEAIEIIACTEKSRKSIQEVAVWQE